MSPRLPLSAALLSLCLACLAALGCGQRKDPSIALLERENRHLEDVIWQWKDAYEEKVQELESSQRAYRSQRRLDQADELPNPTMQPSPPRPRAANPSGATAKPRSKPADPLAIPLIEGPQELPAPGNAAGSEAEEETRTTRLGRLRPASVELAPADEENDAVESAAEPPEGGTPTIAPAGGEEPIQEIDAEVTHVILNPRLTGGFDFDKTTPGDEGLMLVIEPRNGDGAYVPLPGDISVVVLDPAEQGEAQRVGRWDFDAAETARHLRKSLFGKGIHLELRWPDRAPTHEILRVVVRYTTADKRKLETRRDFSIVLPIEGRWTPVGGSPGGAASEPREELSTAAAPANARPMNAPLNAEPGLLDLPLPDKGEWKAR